MSRFKLANDHGSAVYRGSAAKSAHRRRKQRRRARSRHRQIKMLLQAAKAAHFTSLESHNGKPAAPHDWYAEIADSGAEGGHPLDRAIFHYVANTLPLRTQKEALLEFDCEFRRLLPQNLAELIFEFEPLQVRFAAEMQLLYFNLGVEYGRALEGMGSSLKLHGLEAPRSRAYPDFAKQWVLQTVLRWSCKSD